MRTLTLVLVREWAHFVSEVDLYVKAFPNSSIYYFLMLYYNGKIKIEKAQFNEIRAKERN